MTPFKEKKEQEFSKRVKSLGLGFSGSQFDFLWSFFSHSLDEQREIVRKETIKEIKGKLKNKRRKIDQDGDLWGYTERFVNVIVLWKDILSTLKTLEGEGK